MAERLLLGNVASLLNRGASSSEWTVDYLDARLGIVPEETHLQFAHPESSMIKRVLGQPNFSPQTNATQLFPQINTNFNNLSSVKVNTNI